jgi:DNA-binding NarL/FixJ family response regulator
MSLALLVVDDHHLFRDALHAFLSRDADLRLVAETGSGVEGCKLAESHHPDVVLLDVALPDLDGIEAARAITSRPGAPRVLMLSAYGDRGRVARALAAGATGYACKDMPGRQLVHAIRQVARGELVVPALEEPPAADGKSALHKVAELQRLTKREQEVFDLLIAGDNNRSIAGKLHISVKTVETHRARVLHKLDAHTLVDLVRFAARNGLL